MLLTAGPDKLDAAVHVHPPPFDVEHPSAMAASRSQTI